MVHTETLSRKGRGDTAALSEHLKPYRKFVQGLQGRGMSERYIRGVGDNSEELDINRDHKPSL